MIQLLPLCWRYNICTCLVMDSCMVPCQSHPSCRPHCFLTYESYGLELSLSREITNGIALSSNGISYSCRTIWNDSVFDIPNMCMFSWWVGSTVINSWILEWSSLQRRKQTSPSFHMYYGGATKSRLYFTLIIMSNSIKQTFAIPYTRYFNYSYFSVMGTKIPVNSPPI